MERVRGVPAWNSAGANGGTEWRLLMGDDGPEQASGPWNMAVDAALLSAVRAGAPPVLRLYRWVPPTLSFGRNQPAAGLYDEAAARSRGIAFVRRPTGGQAVLHDDELTYAVVAPVGVIGKPRAAYARINGALVGALRSLGLAAGLAAPAPAPGLDARRGVGGAGRGSVAEASGAPAGRGAAARHDWASACFRTPARGEVVVGGRKLVGSAQRTEGRTILQHGSILVGGSQAAAEELLVAPVGGVAGRGDPGWTTIESELGRRPGWEALTAAVVAGFASALGIRLAPHPLSTAETAEARRQEGRFASRDWTWRR